MFAMVDKGIGVAGVQGFSNFRGNIEPVIVMFDVFVGTDLVRPVRERRSLVACGPRSSCEERLFPVDKFSSRCNKQIMVKPIYLH